MNYPTGSFLFHDVLGIREFLVPCQDDFYETLFVNLNDYVVCMHGYRLKGSLPLRWVTTGDSTYYTGVLSLHRIRWKYGSAMSATT